MVYKRFRWVIIARILFLSALIFLLNYLLLETEYIAAVIIIAGLIIYNIFMLVHYVEKTNRDLARFLDAVKYSDFSQTFMLTGLGSSFNELKTAFNDVIAKFQQARAEKEESFRYLQTVVQHVGIGLLAYDDTGEINLLNSAAKRLLDVTHLKNISQLERRSVALVDTLKSLETGQRSLIKLHRSGEELQLAIYTTEFLMHSERYRLVSIQNIGSELAETEMEAWQKLIRVLTHEIMNSVTPLSSLAASANELLRDSITETNAPEAAFEDIQIALTTIERRSQGLLKFVNAYRNLTKIPKPNFQVVKLGELLEQLYVLIVGQMAEEGISLEVNVRPASLEITADPELIEQILINLLTNAQHAVTERENPQIQLLGKMDERGHALIEVADNGKGMSRELQSKIFIPFFTTKSGGSGIGLSLSRQIMRLHNGTLTVKSVEGEGTVFTLRF